MKNDPRRSRSFFRRSTALRLLAALLALGFALAGIGIAQAHANLVRSDPPIGATLAEQPARIQLWFSEELEPAFSQAIVYDANRQRVDASDGHVAPGDPTSLILTLKPNLAKGTYVIAWTTSSKADGHVIRGTVPFGIGVASAASDSAAIEAPAPLASSGTAFEMIVRWVGLLSAAVLTGSFAFWRLQAKPFRLVTPDSLARRVRGRQTALAGVATVVFLIATSALLILQAAINTDLLSPTALGGAVLKVVSDTRYGQLVSARWLLGAILGVLLLLRARRDPGNTMGIDRLGSLGSAALLAGISLTSHSAAGAITTPLGSIPLAVVADWLHLIAAAIWVGGLVQLSALLPLALTNGEPADRGRLLGALIPRFSLAAAGSLAILGVTGLIEALIHVGTLDNLLETSYGQALLIKLLLIFPLITLGAVNHFIVRPALRKTKATSSGSILRLAFRLTRTLRWTARFEILLIAGVIGAVGVMTSLSPAQQPSVVSGAGPLTLAATASDLTATLTIAPGRPGPNQYLVAILDRRGQPDNGIERVMMRLIYRDSDLGMTEVSLASDGGGRFTGSGQDLAISGQWQAEVIIRRAGHDDTQASFAFTVTPTGANVVAPPPLEPTWHFALGLLLTGVGILAIRRGTGFRRDDLRRAAVIIICGLGIVSIGGYFAVVDIQQAHTIADAKALAQFHPATPKSIVNGELVYRQNCAQCHGPGARGNGPLAPTLNPRPSDLVLHVPLHIDKDLDNWIADGFPGSAMPAFRGKLTDQDRWDVINFLRSLTQRADSDAVSP